MMNERLDELYKDALRFAYDNTDATTPNHIVNTVSIGKFAELIIKECATVVMGYENHHSKLLDHFEVE